MDRTVPLSIKGNGTTTFKLSYDVDTFQLEESENVKRVKKKTV